MGVFYFKPQNSQYIGELFLLAYINDRVNRPQNFALKNSSLNASAVGNAAITSKYFAEKWELTLKDKKHSSIVEKLLPLGEIFKCD